MDFIVPVPPEELPSDQPGVYQVHSFDRDAIELEEVVVEEVVVGLHEAMLSERFGEFGRRLPRQVSPRIFAICSVALVFSGLSSSDFS